MPRKLSARGVSAQRRRVELKSLRTGARIVGDEPEFQCRTRLIPQKTRGIDQHLASRRAERDLAEQVGLRRIAGAAVNPHPQRRFRRRPDREQLGAAAADRPGYSHAICPGFFGGDHDRLVATGRKTAHEGDGVGRHRQENPSIGAERLRGAHVAMMSRAHFLDEQERATS